MVQLKFSNTKNAILCVWIFILSSCSTNNTTITDIPEEEIETEAPTGEAEIEETLSESSTTTIGELGTVTFYNEEQIEDHYILVNDAAANSVYLMDKNADLVYEWPLGDRIIGNDVILLNDGTLLASLESDNPDFQFGGQGGIIQIIDKWESFMEFQLF